MFREHNGKTERTIKCVFGVLHVLEKVGEVGDTGHVGFGKLYAAADFEFTGHDQEAAVSSDSSSTGSAAVLVACQDSTASS